MRVQIDVELDYDVPQRTTLLLQILPETGPGQTVHSQNLTMSAHADRVDMPGDQQIGLRSWLTVENSFTAHLRADVTVSRPMADLSRMQAARLPDVPADIVTFLMASRYCYGDVLGDFLSGFNHLDGGALILALRDWCQHNLIYDNTVSNAQTTSLNTFYAGRGVCRDFAHLMITLARSSSIPARMASVYGPDVSPQDFHAVAEVWLDGDWHMVDATGMTTPDRLVRIGVGHDASDIAFLTSFGQVVLKNQAVFVAIL